MEEENENLIIEDVANPDELKSKSPYKRGLTFYESIKKGPVEKYISHGIFPWKLIINILLIIFTILQIVLIVSEVTSYKRAQIRGLYNLFIDDSDKMDEKYNKKTYLYTLEELRSQIHTSINNYYNIKDLTLNPVEYPENNPSPVVEFRYLDNKRLNENNLTKEYFPEAMNRDHNDSVPLRQYYYKLNQTNLGIFDMEEDLIKEFLNDVIDFRINYTIVTKYPYLYEDNLECNIWKIHQTYSFQSRAHFVCTVEINSSKCNESSRVISWFENFMNKQLYIHLIIIILASFSFYFTMKSMYILAKMYMEARKRVKDRKEAKASMRKKTESSVSSSSEDSIYFNPLFDTESTEEEDELPKTDSLFKKKNKKGEVKKHFDFLQFWSSFIITGNLLQILGSTMALNSPEQITTNISFLIGSGCLFACISIGKYIEMNKDYSTIYETLKRSFPVVIRYLLGALPIFFGFLFLGLCIFWRSERFTHSSLGSVTLFSMMNGDVIFDTFSDLSEIGFFFGQVYCYSFCVIFIFIMLNIFISIIEEAYVVTKIKNKTSWIYNYVELEPKLVDIKLHSKPSLVITKKYFQKMEKSSQFLQKRLSKSLRSHDILRMKALESPSSPDKSVKSRSKSLLKKNKKEARSVSRVFFAESIPENEEFDNRFKESLFPLNKVEEEDLSRKVSLSDDKEKIVDDYFTKIENRFENIKKLSDEVMQTKYTTTKRKSSFTMLENYESRAELKQSLLNKIMVIENKAKELRQIWISNY